MRDLLHDPSAGYGSCHEAFANGGVRATKQISTNRKSEKQLDAIFDVNPYADTVLDYGCSFGVFMKMAKDRGLCTYGVDVNQEAIDYMRDLGYQALLGSQIGAAKEFGIRFSAIVMNDVLYYMKEPIRAITSSFDLLKPGGVLVLRVSNKASWLALAIKISGVRQSVIKDGCLDHFHVADARQYCRTLEKIGFSEIRVIGGAFSADSSEMSFSSLAAYRAGTLVRKLSFGKWVLDPGVLITAARPF